MVSSPGEGVGLIRFAVERPLKINGLGFVHVVSHIPCGQLLFVFDFRLTQASTNHNVLFDRRVTHP